MNKPPTVCVIGAGVVGLTAALKLRESIRDVPITVLADKFEENTTSYVAAGVFRPGTSFCGPSDDITKRWVRDSWDHWNDLLNTSEAPDVGVTSLSGYIFSKENPSVVRNHLMEDIVPIYRSATEEELKICGDDWKFGSFFSTLLVESRLYLPWARKKLLNNGGIIKMQNIESFAKVMTEYDYIFNCTGLGARDLCNDMKLVPIRGQVIKVEAPWLKMAFYGDYDTYILPGFEGVTLGGTRQYDSYNTDLCKHDAAAIMERCTSLVPGLKNARVIRHAVGLRPHRSPVRVEGEVVSEGGERGRIIHCYGHGGYGVTCAPGTASHAVRIMLDWMKSNSKL